MIGPLKRFARRALAHGIDRFNRNRLDPHRRMPPPALWGLEAGKDAVLHVHGRSLASIAAEYGTPLHVVDRERLRRNFSRFEGAFARRYPAVAVGYSYKTNPLPGVLRTLHDCGAFAEVISHFELWLALHLNVPPERIIFNGPGKTLESLELAVERGVFMVNIDGAGEIDTLDHSARRHGRTQPVAIRVVTSVGWSGQFGLDIRSGAALAAARRIHACANVELRGLHVHLGTGIADVATYLRAIRDVLAFGDRLHQELGVTIEVFDFGGGFGVPTVRKFSGVDQLLLDHELPPTIAPIDDRDAADEYAAAITQVLADHWRGRPEPRPLIVFEPGRAISSSAQLLLLRVLAIKKIRSDRLTVILDGGRNIVMPPSWEHHGLLPVQGVQLPATQLHDFYGPLCHPGDLLFRGRWLPELAVGDLVAVMDAGAYFIPNQMNFSNPRPAAVLASPEGVTLIRERETFDDIIQLDRLTPLARADESRPLSAARPRG